MPGAATLAAAQACANTRPRSAKPTSDPATVPAASTRPGKLVIAECTSFSTWAAGSPRGTLIRLQVDHLPGGGDPPVWLWSSKTGMTGTDVDLRWQAALRTFDLEQTFRLMKQTLGLTRPKVRTPEAGERWTWLVIGAHTHSGFSTRSLPT